MYINKDDVELNFGVLGYQCFDLEDVSIDVEDLGGLDYSYAASITDRAYEQDYLEATAFANSFLTQIKEDNPTLHEAFLEVANDASTSETFTFENLQTMYNAVSNAHPSSQVARNFKLHIIDFSAILNEILDNDEVEHLIPFIKSSVEETPTQKARVARLAKLLQVYAESII